MGEERFKRYVTAFHYGNEDVSGNPGKHDGLTQAWLTSSLKISPLEQLTFLRKIVTRQLPVNATAWGMYERMGFERFPQIDFRQGNLEVFGFSLSLKR